MDDCALIKRLIQDGRLEAVLAAYGFEIQTNMTMEGPLDSQAGAAMPGRINSSPTTEGKERVPQGRHLFDYGRSTASNLAALPNAQEEIVNQHGQSLQAPRFSYQHAPSLGSSTSAFPATPVEPASGFYNQHGRLSRAPASGSQHAPAFGPAAPDPPMVSFGTAYSVTSIAGVQVVDYEKTMTKLFAPGAKPTTTKPMFSCQGGRMPSLDRHSQRMPEDSSPFQPRQGPWPSSASTPPTIAIPKLSRSAEDGNDDATATATSPPHEAAPSDVQVQPQATLQPQQQGDTPSLTLTCAATKMPITSNLTEATAAKPPAVTSCQPQSNDFSSVNEEALMPSVTDLPVTTDQVTSDIAAIHIASAPAPNSNGDVNSRTSRKPVYEEEVERSTAMNKVQVQHDDCDTMSPIQAHASGTNAAIKSISEPPDISVPMRRKVQGGIAEKLATASLSTTTAIFQVPSEMMSSAPYPGAQGPLHDEPRPPDTPTTDDVAWPSTGGVRPARNQALAVDLNYYDVLPQPKDVCEVDIIDGLRQRLSAYDTDISSVGLSTFHSSSAALPSPPCPGPQGPLHDEPRPPDAPTTDYVAWPSTGGVRPARNQALAVDLNYYDMSQRHNDVYEVGITDGLRELLSAYEKEANSVGLSAPYSSCATSRSTTNFKVLESSFHATSSTSHDILKETYSRDTTEVLDWLSDKASHAILTDICLNYQGPKPLQGADIPSTSPDQLEDALSLVTTSDLNIDLLQEATKQQRPVDERRASALKEDHDFQRKSSMRDKVPKTLIRAVGCAWGECSGFSTLRPALRNPRPFDAPLRAILLQN
ncbi:hypothetical protein SDRG_16276 [Saprolegnia diclina VS20]|uniref:Uncharacterized protein n=1 Tax=Saprolegnia diclina (strain VS20) TaxID=1156394 RepID=T0PXR4_SAPDV|nr:hypothetical protein SDRG_16276 [Saprolegnia diclina VS20]EQC25825.1 hypothetical protein SDRG_16276 [Saprolegnia diclina VS20]|eukprot:XP_008620700.1 hypothetical protein SDRG_16276 [Saprolegnia diclina VS20]